MWRTLWAALGSAEPGGGADAGQGATDEPFAILAQQLFEEGFSAAVDEILAHVGRFLAADRCYLALIDKDGARYMTANEWCSEHADPCDGSSITVPKEHFPALSDVAEQLAPLQVSDLDDLPEDALVERRLLEQKSVRSAAITPMTTAGKVIGWMGLEAVTEARTWSEAQMTFIKRTANLLAAAHTRQQEEDALRRLALAVEQSPTTVIVTDPDGIIEYVNPKFTETSGYAPEQAIGKTMKVPEMPEIPSEVYRNLWATVTAGKEWRGELLNRRKDGHLYWEAVSISPIRDPEGTITHYIGVKEDISDRKSALEELEQAKEEADRANRAKSEFLANMSHEIRTPVNAIIGISHLALHGEVSDKQRDHLKKIRASSQNLLGIINAILDYSNIDAGRMVIESFDFQLDDVLDNLRELLESKARDKGLELILSIPAELPRSLEGDPFRLGQVLINLGNNAIKFTEKGGVVIACETIEEDEASVVLRFSVRDSGIGISEKDIGRLFDPFTQVDTSHSRLFGGTGLGLAIARRLVEMMGGEIGVTSTPGKGSEFYFSVRLLRQTHSGPALPMPYVDLRGLKILVVDDSRTSRTVLCETLETFTFKPVAVESGEAAIKELEKKPASDEDKYDLVLMDWKMPSMDGLEASRRIKDSDGVHESPPVILITGYGREDIIHQAESDLLDGFLLKPVNPSLLFDAIMNAMGKEGGMPEAAEETPAIPAPPPMKAGRILVVEDNALNQEVAQELLADLGVEVSLADNGQAALEILETETFDVVLMDVQMPIMDGFEATREIRKRPELEGLPIVAMTAHAMTGDRERCLEAGMDDYTSKPIDIDHLCEILSRWIEPSSLKSSEEPEVPVTEGEQPIPEVEGINSEAGLSRLGGNRKLFRKLLLEFHHDYRDVIGTVRTALDLGHNESGLRLLHTLKGVAATIGAEGVHIAARDLEAGVRAGDEGNMNTLLNNLSRSLDPILRSLSALDANLDRATTSVAQAPTVAVDPVAVQPIMIELLRLLDEGDPEAGDYLIRLSEKLAAAGFSSHLEALEQHIDNFDFDEAASSLRELAAAVDITLDSTPT